jgi:hypothetical protein
MKRFWRLVNFGGEPTATYIVWEWMATSFVRLGKKWRLEFRQLHLKIVLRLNPN